jgi:hypothetical protein
METSGLVHAKYVDSFVDEYDSHVETVLSPDTDEFLALEQQVLEEEQRDQFSSPPATSSSQGIHFMNIRFGRKLFGQIFAIKFGTKIQ